LLGDVNSFRLKNRKVGDYLVKVEDILAQYINAVAFLAAARSGIEAARPMLVNKRRGNDLPLL
jgi:hypothetical protein